MTIQENNVLSISKATKRGGSRDEALLHLIPKMLGIVCEGKGMSARLPSSRLTVLPTGVELSAHFLAPSRIMLSAYSPVNDRIVKVFSAHVTERSELADPAFYRYVGGSVGLLNWRRGEWEDTVMAHAAQAMTAVDLILKLKA